MHRTWLHILVSIDAASIGCFIARLRCRHSVCEQAKLERLLHQPFQIERVFSNLLFFGVAVGMLVLPLRAWCNNSARGVPFCLHRPLLHHRTTVSRHGNGSLIIITLFLLPSYCFFLFAQAWYELTYVVDSLYMRAVAAKLITPHPLMNAGVLALAFAVLLHHHKHQPAFLMNWLLKVSV